MNLILLDQHDFTENNNALLKGRRAEHAISVLNTEVGKTIKVGLVNGNIGQGQIISIEDKCITLKIDNLNITPPSPLPITLIVAMQRPKTMKKILQSATAMAVKKFYIIETWKVEKSYWTSPLLLPENIEEQLRLGLEQGGDTVLPEIIIKKRFKPFVEDELPEILKGTTGLVAHPTGEKPCPHQAQKKVTLAIGPEGGFTDYEVEKFTDEGMKAVNIGKRTLRSEFAVTAILGKLF